MAVLVSAPVVQPNWGPNHIRSEVDLTQGQNYLLHEGNNLVQFTVLSAPASYDGHQSLKTVRVEITGRKGLKHKTEYLLTELGLLPYQDTGRWSFNWVELRGSSNFEPTGEGTDATWSTWFLALNRCQYNSD